MILVGKFTGTFVSEREMKVDEELYKKYLADNPDFDIEDSDELELMWDFFKREYNCYDEITDSCDYDTTLTEMEIVNE